MELTPTNIFLGEILPSKCDFVVEFHLKFTDTKNLIFITHNLLPGNSSLTFTFKSKKETFKCTNLQYFGITRYGLRLRTKGKVFFLDLKVNVNDELPGRRL